MAGERPEFLPPQPAGPEPEVGKRQAPEQPAGASQYAPQQPPPGWAQPPQPAEPDNGAAVAGFVLSLVSVALLFLSAGLSSLISLGCAIAGLVYSRKGKRKVESGETTRNRGLAQAGFIVSIVALVLSAIATAAWTAILIGVATDEDFRRDFENEFDDGNTIRAALQPVPRAALAATWVLGAAGGRIATNLLA